MTTPLDPYQSQLAELCRKFNVRRLELFGSAVEGRFKPESSDFDFLVTFDPSPLGPADQFLGLLEGLEDLLGRKVDLVVERAIKNPIFRDQVNRSKVALYAA